MPHGRDRGSLRPTCRELADGGGAQRGELGIAAVTACRRGGRWPHLPGWSGHQAWQQQPAWL